MTHSLSPQIPCLQLGELQQVVENNETTDNTANPAKRQKTSHPAQKPLSPVNVPVPKAKVTQSVAKTPTGSTKGTAVPDKTTKQSVNLKTPSTLPGKVAAAALPKEVARPAPITKKVEEKPEPKVPAQTKVAKKTPAQSNLPTKPSTQYAKSAPTTPTKSPYKKSGSFTVHKYF